MSTATAIQTHIAYELIENTKHQIVVIEFVSHDIISPAHARELGEQLRSLIRSQPLAVLRHRLRGRPSAGQLGFQ